MSNLSKDKTMKTELASILREELKKGIVSFRYKKLDGTVRSAKGTTNSRVVEEMYQFKGGEGPEKYGYVVYFDTDRGDFRCFSPERLISIEQ